MMADAAYVAEGSGIGAMVRDFVLRASGGDERATEICGRLLAYEESGGVCMPLTAEEAEVLRGKAPLVSEAPDVSGLFVLAADGGLLYTRRNWGYEETVRRRIAAMAQMSCDETVAIPEGELFHALNKDQLKAVENIARRSFTILTGGPGTGKTYTIARAVKLIFDRNPGVRLGLAAPTGKAAARVNEAMQQEAQSLKMEDLLPTVTLHSLLRPNFDSATFKHNRSNPLPLDWLIVDEASMVSLPLMAKLLDALPEGCRLTLVGDANQLSSVEPGRVFGDLCGMSAVRENDCVCELRESRRFPPDGEIAKLADFVNNGDWQSALALLKAPNNRTLRYIDLDGAADAANDDFMDTVESGFDAFRRCGDAREALRVLNDCRVLCAVRQGPFGSERLNARILERLRKKDRGCPVPVLITRNDWTLGVNNGDVGVIPAEDGGTVGRELSLMREGVDEVRHIPVSLLPDRELAFATTIHKAQGSEFRNVILVLPKTGADAAPCPLLTRELLYTALTRTGSGQCFLYADDAAIRRCCENRTERCTGLAGK